MPHPGEKAFDYQPIDVLQTAELDEGGQAQAQDEKAQPEPADRQGQRDGIGGPGAEVEPGGPTYGHVDENQAKNQAGARIDPAF